MAVHVGIGSWADDAYVGVLYPERTPKKDRLPEYAKHLGHVEVNASYYATPKAAAVAGWVAQTPDTFTFSVKLHRAIAQSPAKAAQSGILLDKLGAGMAPLLEARRLTSFFLVLPATFAPGRHRLEELDTLVEKLAPIPLAVELRHSGWIADGRQGETLRYFRERRLIWIVVDMPQIQEGDLMPWVSEVTHPEIAYVRLHGRNPNYPEAKSAAEGHHYAYTARELSALAKRINQLGTQAREVYVIANNHAEDFAPRTALALQRKLLERQ